MDGVRAAVVGELWGQSMIPWGHCWHGDQAADQDPRGGFSTQQQFLEVTRTRVETKTEHFISGVQEVCVGVGVSEDQSWL